MLLYTDRQTNRRGETEICHFEFYHRDSAASYCSSCESHRRPRRLRHNLSYKWSCRSKVQRAVKKQNMTTFYVRIYRLYSYFAASLMWQKMSDKFFQNGRQYRCSKCVSEQVIFIITVISYGSVFCSILLPRVKGGDNNLQAYISQNKNFTP